jgi:cell division protease FtsH
MNIYQGGDSHQFSDETAKRIDTEIANMVQVNYEKAKSILQENIDALHRIAHGLMLWETLDADQIRKLIAGEDIGQPIISKKPPVTESSSDVGMVSGKVAPA